MMREPIKTTEWTPMVTHIGSSHMNLVCEDCERWTANLSVHGFVLICERCHREAAELIRGG